MSKKRFVFIFIISPLLLWRGGSGDVFSQNLVPNHLFETIDTCPNTASQIYYASPWFQPCIYNGNTINSSSSDLFDTCNSSLCPSGPLGFQIPLNNSHGYAGIICFADTFNIKEYIEVPLLSPLVANRRYCIEFYVSLANYSQFAISNIGAYFSIDSLLDITNHYTINYVTPQIQNPITNVLNDTANWMLVSGNFIASGGEKFLTIGNFQLPSNTNFVNLGWGVISFAYYFIDDISVIDCDTTDVGVNELELSNDELVIYPNPANDKIMVYVSKYQSASLKIVDVVGKLVYQSVLTNRKSEINISELPGGIYFVEVQTENGIERRKLIKK